MVIKKCHFQVLAVQTVGLVVVCLSVFLIVWVRTLPQAGRARAFLRDFTKLKVGNSTFDEAKSLAEKYNGIPWWVSDGSMRCTYQNCVFRFAFENKPLSSSHLVPWVGLIGAITVKDGLVTEKDVFYHRYAKRPLSYDIREMVVPLNETPESQGKKAMLGVTRMNVDSAGIPSAVSVGLEPSSSPDQKRRAYALDTSCLSRWYGCNSVSSFFPSGIPFRAAPFQTHSETW
jgi:hypothetical protein